MTPKFSWVTFRWYRGSQLNMAQARMIQTEDGRYWALPDGADLDQDPRLSDAYSLDPLHLERLPDTPEGVPAYLYRKVLHVPQ